MASGFGFPTGGELVIRPPRCFGRSDEFAKLRDALTKNRPTVLLLLGTAGIGKTTLTREVASCKQVITRFRERRWFVKLETANNAAEMETAITQAIGLLPSTPFRYTVECLKERASLLILDNLETPRDKDELGVQELMQSLATTPNVSLLVSMRGGNPPPSPRWSHSPIVLDPLPIRERRRLFLEFARGVAADDPHLTRFLDALGGVPLAIELIAQRAGGDTSLRELWEQWEHRGGALARHPDLPEDRLTSLERSLYISWRSKRLRKEGRVLFRILGQLPAGISHKDRGELLRESAAEGARQLKAVGLAFQHEDRLDLLPTVRDYARRVHPPRGPAAAPWKNHFLSLGESFGKLVGRRGGASAAARLAPETANVEAALLAAIDGETRSRVVRAAFFFAEFCRFAGRGGSVLQELATICAGGDRDGEAKCVECQADIARTHFQYLVARDGYDRASEIYRDLGAHDREAWCILCVADIALACSDYASAQAGFDQALQLYVKAKDEIGKANSQLRLADVELERAEYKAARTDYHRAKSLYNIGGAILGEVTWILGEANCIKGLADVDFDLGDLEVRASAMSVLCLCSTTSPMFWE